MSARLCVSGGVAEAEPTVKQRAASKQGQRNRCIGASRAEGIDVYTLGKRITVAAGWIAAAGMDRGGSGRASRGPRLDPRRRLGQAVL